MPAPARSAAELAASQLAAPETPARAPGLPPIPALLLAAVSIQGGAALATTLFPLLGPVLVTSLRVSIAALLLLLVMRPGLRVGRAGWAALLPYGLSLGVMNLCYYLALERIPLGLTVTLEFVGPLTVALLGSRRPADFGWVGLAAAGLLLITPWPGSGAGSAGGQLDPLGVLLALTAGAMWGLYIVCGRRVAATLPGPRSVALGMGVAALTTLPFGLHALLAGAGAHLSAGTLLLALGVAVLSSALPYTLELQALRQLPARVFGVLMSLEPAVAGVIGLIFLGQHLSALQWLSSGCVIAASAGMTLSARSAD